MKLSKTNLSAADAGLVAAAASADISIPDTTGTIHAVISADLAKTKNIFGNQVGIFYEDLGRAADGGLYAELIENRDFEYTAADKDGWNAMTGWQVLAPQNYTAASIETKDPIHANNPHYISLRVQTPNTVILQNNGFGGFRPSSDTPGTGGFFDAEPDPGIPVKRGAAYRFSTFMRYVGTGNKHYVHIALTDQDGNTLAEGNFYREKTNTWEKITVELVSNADCDNATLSVIPQTKGDYHFDMISLFPKDTFKGRENGLRKDLAQAIADLHPSFIRFPGGCVIHGDSIANAYRWEETIGPLEARVPLRNMRHYHQTRGLGYFEYFQFCEDIGAEALPVVPVGGSCQFQSKIEYVPMEDMPKYVESILHLVEWANGPADSEWGAKRAAAGHPAPFNMKYLALGNEERYTPEYEERFTMVCKALQEKYPEIKLVGNAGPGADDDYNDVTGGQDFVLGWKLARDLKMYMVDEHYYKPASWVYDNQDYYDTYDRNGPRVFLGEFNFISKLSSGIEAALTTGLYQLMMERNGDLVQCGTYSLSLIRSASLGYGQMTMIQFNRSSINKASVYYILKMFAENCGSKYAETKLTYSVDTSYELKRMGGTVVIDDKTGDVIVKFGNLTGRPVELKLDLGKDVKVGEKAQLITFTAENFSDMTPVVESKEISGASPDMRFSAAPYSMTVLRLHTK